MKRFYSMSVRRAVAFFSAFLLVALLFGPLCADNGSFLVRKAQAAEPSFTDFGGNGENWGDLQAAVFAGGLIRLQADFKNDPDEAHSDNHAVFNSVYYSLAENGGIFPKYPGHGPLLVVKDTTIDLNGHTLKRDFGNNNMHSAGMVIWVRDGAKLTIIDSSADNSGVICNGHNKGRSSYATWTDDSDSSVSIQYQESYGGGIYVEGEGSSVVLKGGTLKNNSCSYMTTGNGGLGGGVYVSDGATCSVFMPAKITGNEAINGFGGGICSDDGATIMVEDEACVEGNKSPKDKNDNIHFNSQTNHHEFTVKYVLEDDPSIEVAAPFVGMASDGATISSSDVEDPSSFTYTEHLIGRGEATSLTVSANTEQDILLIKYKKLIPTATVSDVTAPDGVRIYELPLNPTDYIVNIEKAKKFTADAITDAQYTFYKNWHCDFAVSFDRDTEPGSFGLYGSYGNDEVAFIYPENGYGLPAGQKIYLLSSILGNADICTYAYIHDVVKNFTCGAFNLSGENIGTGMTVELVMWPADGSVDDGVVLNSFEYSFTDVETIIPELPEAECVEVTPAPSLIDLSNLNQSETNQVVGKIGSAYQFSVDPSADQLSYYGNWGCDFVISFDKAAAAGSVGLYGSGAYGVEDVAFAYPLPLTAGQEVFLMRDVLQNPCTFAAVAANANPFTCGAFNLSNDNIGTNMTVKLVIWDSSSENPVYYPICTVVEYALESPAELLGPYTVSLTSIDQNGNTVANLIGGGEYKYGATAVVEAPEVENYVFEGWYIGSERVAESLTYEFTVTDDADLVACYVCDFTEGNLRIVGDNYTVDDSETQTGDADFTKIIGKSVTLKYVGEDFLYWVNRSGNIVSTSAEYTFVFVGQTEIRLVTDKNEEARVHVVVLNGYSQVLLDKIFSGESEIESELNAISPAKMGYTFVKWVFKGTKDEATPAAIMALAETEKPFCEIVPLYSATDENAQYFVTVMLKNGDSVVMKSDYYDMGYQVGNKAVFSISDVKEWFELTDEDEFSFWSLDGGDSMASNEDQYTLLSAKSGASFVLTAVFNVEVPDAEAGISIVQMYGSQNSGKYVISTTMRYFIPEGCTVLESGFVYSTKGDYASDADALVIGADKCYKHIGSSKANTAIYTFNGIVGNNHSLTLYLKAYVIYLDGGVAKTLYSDMGSGSYDSLTQ